MKLVKILPDKIQIKTNDAEFNNSRINDLIDVADKEVELVTMITAITDTDTDEQIGDETFLEELEQPSLKMIECSILGSIIDGEFKNQIDRYPSTDVHIYKVNEHDFYYMLSGNEARSDFCLGKYASYNVPAYIDGNKFYQRHSCIVGNTGCGKSETVAKIMEETTRATNCNMIVFDIHGEYRKLSYVDNIDVGSDFAFPVWMLGFQSMCANILKVREESTVTMSALRKAYYSQCHDVNESKPYPFSFLEMYKYIKMLNSELVETGEYYKTGEKAGQAKTVKGEYNGKLSGIVNTIETLMSDKRYAFLFVDAGWEYLIEFINRIMGGEKPVKNIDLSNVPHDVAIVIIGAIASLIYHVQLQQKREEIKPVTLVCDEAHVYIPVDFQLSASQKRMVEIFENIAKEGRKFGITLFVASQRPSELNRTIMAQCANYIVMKLNNENDKTLIKGMMSEGSSAVIEQTTMFVPGDVLVIGDAAPIALKIHVDLAEERPASRTIDFWDEWKAGKQEADYSLYLEEYLKN